MLLLHTHTQLHHLFYSEKTREEKTKIGKTKGSEGEQEGSQIVEEDSEHKEEEPE